MLLVLVVVVLAVASLQVLVLFGAPWCAPCAELAPTYERLALAFRDEDAVAVATVRWWPRICFLSGMRVRSGLHATDALNTAHTAAYPLSRQDVMCSLGGCLQVPKAGSRSLSLSLSL